LEDLDDDAARRFKEKHSLDSDEEDENTEKYDIMHEGKQLNILLILTIDRKVCK
jgi:hypothetical protein